MSEYKFTALIWRGAERGYLAVTVPEMPLAAQPTESGMIRAVQAVLRQVKKVTPIIIPKRKA